MDDRTRRPGPAPDETRGDRLRELQRRVGERPTPHLGDLLEMAEAQDRGAWPLAARLRGLRRLGL